MTQRDRSYRLGGNARMPAEVFSITSVISSGRESGMRVPCGAEEKGKAAICAVKCVPIGQEQRSNAAMQERKEAEATRAHAQLLCVVHRAGASRAVPKKLAMRSSIRFHGLRVRRRASA